MELHFNKSIANNGLPKWLSGKESACQCRRHRRVVSISGLGRSSRVGNGNLLQYSCLKNSMDRGVWWATVMWLQSQTWLSTHTQWILHCILEIYQKKGDLKCSYCTPPQKKGEMIEMLSRLVVELILQYTCISTHYVVHLIYVWFLYILLIDFYQ